MSLQAKKRVKEVGVRELHDRLSQYLRQVAAGGEVIVTLRGKRLARLTAVDAEDPLDGLRRRGLVTEPKGTGWEPPADRPKPKAPVADLVARQRR